MTEADLLRFVNAQEPVYSQVLEELTAGRKRTHWMWFIFPQLRGLGHSAMAQRYAIRDLGRFRSYGYIAGMSEVVAAFRATDSSHERADPAAQTTNCSLRDLS